MLEARRRIRAGLKHLWYTPDRFLHPYRTGWAEARLRKVEMPARILVVCYGNICRSAYAAHALPALLPPDAESLVTLQSAGFIGPGRPSPPEAVRVAARRGVDLTPHRSRLLTLEAVVPSSVVLVMDGAQRDAVVEEYGKDPDQVWLLGDLDPEPVTRRAIEDPYGQPEAVFERIFDRIDRSLRTLVEALPLEGVEAGPHPWGPSIEGTGPPHPGQARRPWNSRHSGV